MLNRTLNLTDRMQTGSPSSPHCQVYLTFIVGMRLSLAYSSDRRLTRSIQRP
jgi:hypothetical protein